MSFDFPSFLDRPDIASIDGPHGAATAVRSRRAENRKIWMLGAAAWLAVLAAMALPAFADEASENRAGVLIEGATLSKAPIGGTSILKMSITNQRRGPLVLTGIRSHFSDSAIIDVGDPSVGRKQTEELYILQNETLQLDTSHIQVRFPNLSKELSLGDHVILKIVFKGMEVDATADVH